MVVSPYCPYCHKKLALNQLKWSHSNCGKSFDSPGRLFSSRSTPPPCPEASTCTCPCTQVLGARVCQHCRRLLPVSIAEGCKVINIIVAGHPGVGKSSFISAAVERMRQLSSAFHWRWIECYTGPKDNTWLYELHRNKKSWLISLQENEVGANSLKEAEALAGIIYVMQPGQFQMVHAELPSDNSTTVSSDEWDDTCNRIICLGQRFPKLPQAIVLNKIDKLQDNSCRWAFDPVSHLTCCNSGHQGALNQQELETVNCEIENWLSTAEPALAELSQQSYSMQFFGIHATAPPLRVEDPLLWVLSQNGIIR